MAGQQSTIHEAPLAIRGMVCTRCIQVVRQDLERLGFTVSEVRLGHVRLQGRLSPVQIELIRKTLEKEGFSLLTDAKVTLVHRMKALIEQTLDQHDSGEPRGRLSELIANEFHANYDALSALFSSSEGQTLERYVIERRLDKVKELLVYTDLPLTDIAYQTGFSSVSHLSNQFKRLTGLSPSYFRTIRQEKQAIQQHTA
ncbi:AraC-like DNA-binding protein [Spirosoma lacussanchae]|uniref:AraC family transcriptional regulator n=1 Tax=Spirosoma lacussanchae TaxID=1884249 RepID=UPI0014870364|nr:response regulator transcription factor [Spirosoma lacussanchae]